MRGVRGWKVDSVGNGGSAAVVVGVLVSQVLRCLLRVTSL
jgi:hypothetical protein